MQVSVELKAYLSRYSPDGQPKFQQDLPDGATVQTLVSRLNVPDEDATVIVVNDRNVDFDEPLADGDRVTFIPPLSGGSFPPQARISIRGFHPSAGLKPCSYAPMPSTRRLRTFGSGRCGGTALLAER